MAETKDAEVQPRDEIVRSEIMEACEKIESEYINLAELFREVWENAYFTKWGYDSFEEYVTDEVGVQYRKARYYVKIAQAVKKLGIAWDEIHGIGWTKMRLIAPIMTEDNVKHWLEKANSLTYEKLNEEVADFKEIEGAVRGKGKDKPVKITMSMSKEAAEVFLDAVAKAQKIIDSESVEQAVEHILYEWFMDREDSPEKLPLDYVIDWIKRSYGVEVSPEQPADVSEAVEGEK